MENKFYTPELSEFHIGFEFQKLEIVSKGSFLEEDWVQNKCEADDFIQISRDFTEKTIYTKDDYRVKHLDREDIESLGWKYKKDDLGFFDFCKGNNRLQFFPEKEKNISIFLNSYTIKNKSELRKIMQMLNIE